MFGRTPNVEVDRLNEAKNKILNEMDEYGPSSPEYPALLELLEKVNALCKPKGKWRVSPDTMAIVVGNLAGILIIVTYERMHAMSSKSLSFIVKPKNPSITI